MTTPRRVLPHRTVQAVEVPGIDVMSPRAVADELDELLAPRHPWGDLPHEPETRG